MNIPSLTTTRLVLRPLCLDDLDRLFLIQDDPDVMRYFPNPEPPSREKVLRTIHLQLQHWEQYHYGWWAVESRENNNLIGWAGLQFLPETGESEVAYLLGKPNWGKGLATEAASASLRFGFEYTKIDRFIAIVHPDNIRSQKVITKIGMAFIDKNKTFGMDCFRYSILRSNYHPLGEDFMIGPDFAG